MYDETSEKIYAFQYTIAKAPYAKHHPQHLFFNHPNANNLSLATRMLRLCYGDPNFQTHEYVTEADETATTFTPTNSGVVYVLVSPHQMQAFKQTQYASWRDAAWMRVLPQESLLEVPMISTGMKQHFDSRND